MRVGDFIHLYVEIHDFRRPSVRSATLSYFAKSLCLEVGSEMANASGVLLSREAASEVSPNAATHGRLQIFAFCENADTYLVKISIPIILHD